jgi:hypothetical protein
MFEARMRSPRFSHPDANFILPLRIQASSSWIDPLSAIFGSLIGAGLSIVMFREHEILPWRVGARLR